jgi:ribosome biogenesis GTPase A
MSTTRKKPFSSKQKKEQLKLKREKIRAQGDKWADSDEESATIDINNPHNSRRRINEQPVQDGAKHNPNRYHLHFQRESRHEIDRRKKLAQLPIKKLPEESLEIPIEQIYRPGSALDMPIRPPWTYDMTKEQLEQQEQTYFNSYLDRIFANFESEHLSYFEMNVETWRQLWRTVEICDIILMLVDIRFAVLHFSPTLYDSVTRIHKKQCILLLNKIDLVPPSIVIAVKDYFSQKFPELHILTYTSYPKDLSTTRDDFDNYQVMARIVRRKNYYAIGPLALFECISSLVSPQIDLSSWKQHIQQCMNDEAITNVLKQEKIDVSPLTNTVKTNTHITLGFTGYPNVGKSSVLNSIVGHKVVSVSRTPGHTKHFQTIFLTPTVRLCDCPGLVFPSYVERPLQILAGIYPIAQVQEPYTAVGYLAQWLPMIKLLKLEKLEQEIPNYSAIDICEAWAIKRGFLTAKACRPDIYRAANHILRLALDGRINLSLRPPGFTAAKERYLSDPRSIELEQQIRSAVDKQKRPDSSISGGDDDSEAFPTSDDHQLASCSASASDQGADFIEGLNRFHALNDDDEKEHLKSIKNIRRRPRRKSSNSNPHDDENDEEEGEVD